MLLTACGSGATAHSTTATADAADSDTASTLTDSAAQDDVEVAGTPEEIGAPDLSGGDVEPDPGDDDAAPDATPPACKPTACADGNPCTQDDCSATTGECTHLPLDGTPCSDSDPCTVNESCAGGTCTASPNQADNLCDCYNSKDCEKYDDKKLCNGQMYCDTSVAPFKCKLNMAPAAKCDLLPPKPCFEHVCAEVLGPAGESTSTTCVTVASQGGSCDDGNKMTTGDYCSAGKCMPGTYTAPCKVTADCAVYEDGDLCNGTLFCNQAKAECQWNPATELVCPTVDNSVCGTTVCEPKTGKCVMKFAPLGTPCEDGVACTTGETCVQGDCEPSANTCPCAQDSDCASKEDGDVCNGTLYCDKVSGTCKLNPKTVVTCPTAQDTACKKNACNPATGVCAMANVATGTDCDDGNSCTLNESCQAGQCLAGPVNVCECMADVDCVKKEDGNLCNGTLYCNKAAGTCQVNPATVVKCATVDDTNCAAAKCNPISGKCGLVPVPNDTACDDGNWCTAGDACQAGQCVPGTSTCSCQKDSDCKDDGDLCNGVPYCDKTSGTPTCKLNPATVKSCPTVDDTPCLQTKCEGKTGACKKTPVNYLQSCSDDNPCTAGDTCDASGQCQSGVKLCECENDAECDKLDDGDFCNGRWYCDKTVQPFFVCKPKANSAVVCPKVDDTVCAKNTCQAKSGLCALVPTGTGQPCDDGSACTSGDSCAVGLCSGATVDCDDQNPCTQESCSTTVGCVHTANTAPCSDGSACTVGDHCQNAACLPGTVTDCNDNNPCTADSCEAASGCANLVGPTTCSDGDACTTEACVGAVCVKQPVVCDDGNPCTSDACEASSGCFHASAPGSCDDGDACTGPDDCSSGACN
ncbi:MAG: hypothetical protein HY902_21150, partial [Deltaproteobacteria bacterium]|nr:hypothetical protein [Deltaproteobacteria bacterium]